MKAEDHQVDAVEDRQNPMHPNFSAHPQPLHSPFQIFEAYDPLSGLFVESFSCFDNEIQPKS